MLLGFLADEIANTDMKDWPTSDELTKTASMLFPTDTPFGAHAAAGFVFGCLLTGEYVRRFGGGEFTTTPNHLQ